MNRRLITLLGATLICAFASVSAVAMSPDAARREVERYGRDGADTASDSLGWTSRDGSSTGAIAYGDRYKYLGRSCRKFSYRITVAGQDITGSDKSCRALRHGEMDERVAAAPAASSRPGAHAVAGSQVETGTRAPPPSVPEEQATVDLSPLPTDPAIEAEQVALQVQEDVRSLLRQMGYVPGGPDEGWTPTAWSGLMRYVADVAPGISVYDYPVLLERLRRTASAQRGAEEAAGLCVAPDGLQLAVACLS